MASGLNLERLDVMIVEDNLHIRILVRNILHSFGIRKIIECSDGAEALSVLHHSVIDFVITDWIMEPMNGIDFTREVRTAKDSPNPFLPVIMLTGHTELYRILQARDSGVTEFLAKPVTVHGLYARIKALIENPRSFVRVGNYFGPCRRRKVEEFAGMTRREGDSSDGSQMETDSVPGASKSNPSLTTEQENGLSIAAAAVGKL